MIGSSCWKGSSGAASEVGYFEFFGRHISLRLRLYSTVHKGLGGHVEKNLHCKKKVVSSEEDTVSFQRRQNSREQPRHGYYKMIVI